MKSKINIYLMLLGILLSVTSCQLTEELEDYEPLYALDAETAITSEKTAELALVGAYADIAPLDHSMQAVRKNPVG